MPLWVSVVFDIVKVLFLLSLIIGVLGAILVLIFTAIIASKTKL